MNTKQLLKVAHIMCLCLLLGGTSSCLSNVAESIAQTINDSYGKKAQLTHIEDLGDVQQIAVSKAGVRLHVTQGNATSISIDNPYGMAIEARVDGEELKVIGLDYNIRNRYVDIYVTLPRLKQVQVTGSSDVEVDSLSVSALQASVTGSGSIQLGTLLTEKIQVAISGSGSIGIHSLQTSQLIGKISGSGDLAIEQGRLMGAQLRVTGSGDIAATIIATGTVDAHVTGSGGIYLKGHIAQLKRSNTGSGTIIYNQTIDGHRTR